MLRELIGLFARLPAPLLYLVTAAIGFGESALFLDVVVPGDAGMVLAGAAAARRAANVGVLIAVAALGAWLGDTVGFLVGRRWGMTLVCRWPWVRERLEGTTVRARRYFDRRGAAAVFAARWVGALRAAVPFVAGTADMPLARFLVWDLLGCVSWTAATISLGYVAGDAVAAFIDGLGAWVTVVVVAAAAAWYLRRRSARARSAKRSARQAERPPETNAARTPTADVSGPTRR